MKFLPLALFKPLIYLLVVITSGQLYAIDEKEVQHTLIQSQSIPSLAQLPPVCPYCLYLTCAAEESDITYLTKKRTCCCRPETGVRGATGATGATGAAGTLVSVDFFSAFDTTTQINPTTTFQSITFDTNDVISAAWSHTPGTATFTCNQTGTYIIIFDAGAFMCFDEGAGNSAILFQGLLDATPISGSASSLTFLVDNADYSRFTSQYIVQVTAGQVLQMQFACSTTLVRAFITEAAGATAYITIKRIS